MRALIEEILPAAVAAVEMFDDPPAVDLFPEEEARLTRAVDKRRREFGTVRVCARQALARLGVAPVPILPGPRGAPRWPPGVVGSMTHCAGYRAAAVARAAELRSIGIDAEPHEPVPAGVLGVVSRPEERRHLAELAAASPGTCGDRLLFSAKEAVFKAWYPLTGEELGFDDASVTFDPEGTFVARLQPSAPAVPVPGLGRFTGRWTVRDGLVATAVVVRLPGTPGQAQ
jgi:4'-phosphopantetheinyl transferase EntD